MHSPMKICALTIFSILVIAHSLTGQELKKRVYIFYYDVHRPGSLALCEEATAKCQQWNPRTQFFRSGSLIRLRVLHGRFRSTFKVTVNGIVLADAVPQFRGVSAAPSATQVQAPPTPSPTPIPLSNDPKEALNAIKNQYDATEEAFKKAEVDLSEYLNTYLEATTAAEQAECSAQPVDSPTSMVADIVTFAKQLEIDAQACDSSVPKGDYFQQEDAFNSLTNRADQLIQSVTLLNATLTLPDATGARSAWQTLSGMVAQYEKNFPPAKDPNRSEALNYLSSGDTYKKFLEEEQRIESRLKASQDGINKDLRQINASMSKAFAYINALYNMSESSQSFDLPVGQYNSNYAAAFSVIETANPVVYAVKPATVPSAQDQDNSEIPGKGPKLPPAEIGNPFGPPSGSHPQSSLRDLPESKVVLMSANFKLDSTSQATGAPGKKPAADAQQQSTNPGKVVYSGSFDVHNIYRANLVAGFFVSSLRNRPYGLTNNGQASSGSNITFVTVEGQPYRPQIHAFVGINVYLWERDVFPGQLSKQKFLWCKKDHKWVNGYWNPGIMVGYGVDSLNNYLVGLNWETKWGINFGPGLHVGQETFLQPGIIPGVTQLPSNTTTVPTVNKTSTGVYGSVGFDLSIMKAAFGQLFGGSSAK